MIAFDTEGKILLELARQHQNDLRRDGRMGPEGGGLAGQHHAVAERIVVQVADALIATGGWLRAHSGSSPRHGAAWGQLGS